jgi:hypothetical protein
MCCWFQLMDTPLKVMDSLQALVLSEIRAVGPHGPSITGHGHSAKSGQKLAGFRFLLYNSMDTPWRSIDTPPL